MVDTTNSNPPAGGRERLIARIGLLSALLLLATFLAVGVKLFPVYVDHNFVSSVARSLIENGNVSTMSQTQIRQDLEASLRLNNIRDFDINDIQVNRTVTGNRIHIQYEKRVRLVGNIDLLVSFDEVIE